MSNKKQYSDEFKREAIRLQEISGKSIAVVERELGSRRGFMDFGKPIAASTVRLVSMRNYEHKASVLAAIEWHDLCVNLTFRAKCHADTDRVPPRLIQAIA